LSRQAYQDPRDMFNSIDGHQTTHNSKSCVVGGDVPHTLAFIVSSVFKVLHTTSTQTLQNEANSASNTRRYRTASQPSVHFPASRWLVVSAGRSRQCETPVLGEPITYRGGIELATVPDEEIHSGTRQQGAAEPKRQESLAATASGHSSGLTCTGVEGRPA